MVKNKGCSKEPQNKFLLKKRNDSWEDTVNDTVTKFSLKQLISSQDLLLFTT